MLKQILLFSILITAISIYSENLYEIIQYDGSVNKGYIREDKPGEYIVLEEIITLDLKIIKYSEISIIRLINKVTPIIIEDEVVKENHFDDQLRDILPLDNNVPYIIPTQTTPITLTDIFQREKTELIKELNNLTFLELNNLNLDKSSLKDYTPQDLEEIYNLVKKDNTLKYTLFNIVPGLGSILQGDYNAGLYTLTSILTTLVYNLSYNNSGKDLYFILNLNGVVSYLTSFLAPLRYNQNYNKTIQDKLSL